MSRVFKIPALVAAAVAGLVHTTPIANAQMNPASMSCEEYNQLADADRQKMAVMAVRQVSSAAKTTATDDTVATTTEEGNSAAPSGSATATKVADEGDDLTHFAEEIGMLNRTCSRNWDATVMEAATGSAGTR